MATNEWFDDAADISLPVPAGTKSGDPVRVGSLNGVAKTDRAVTAGGPFNADGSPNVSYNPGGANKDGNASVTLRGAHVLKVTTGAAPTAGTPVYFDPAGVAAKLTTTAGTLKLWGATIDYPATANGDGTWTCCVKVAPIIP